MHFNWFKINGNLKLKFWSGNSTLSNFSALLSARTESKRAIPAKSFIVTRKMPDRSLNSSWWYTLFGIVVIN
ncbi:hypothetical protein CEXT_218001 [Caerostris extrusa]|uniref:Uncharacterized protein n=1 Tax=Caerostris extrusa TaxID=172846 RepID=A0AAV4XS83_CAEEX|nr:hypothetical protein CEXT_218001 [Caerostris extrusa]